MILCQEKRVEGGERRASGNYDIALRDSDIRVGTLPKLRRQAACMGFCTTTLLPRCEKSISECERGGNLHFWYVSLKMRIFAE